MGESTPFFTDTLTSTPFGGTLADTSTPTPAGSLPQVPKATELPGSSGDAERTRKQVANLDDTISQIDQAATFLQNAHYYTGDKWQKRLALGLHGKSDIEPPALMYKRYEMLDSMAKNKAALMQERSRLLEPDPFTKAYLEQTAKESAINAGEVDRQRNLSNLFDQVAPHLQTAGVNADQLAIAKTNFLTNPQGGIKVSSPEDLMKQIKSAADLGPAIGPRGIQDLLSAGAIHPLEASTAMHAYETALQDTLRKASEKTAAEAPIYGGFKTPKELFDSINTAFREDAAIEGHSEKVMVEVPDPLGVGTITRAVFKQNPAQAAASRAAALNSFPGDVVKGIKSAREIFPNYVYPEGNPEAVKTGATSGSSAAPAQIPSPAQKDLTFQQKLDARKAKLDKGK